MLRSNSFRAETLLEPGKVLAALNEQFGMDRHDGNYFTIFYGVYQRSTRTLRYAGAGHPPALLFTNGHVAELPSLSEPVGMFEDTEFPTATVPVAPGSQLLIYSDGVYELPLNCGGQWPHEEFVKACSRQADSPEWTLDDLVVSALDHSATGDFDDDCSLVKLQFE